MNLFNHVLVLFCAKFVCILTFRYPIFRWELCKGCEWESVKKTQDVCIQRSLVTDSQLASHQSGTRVKHVGNWRVTTARALQEKMYSLARQLAHDSFHSRDWVTRMLCVAKKWPFTFLLYTTINTLIPTKCKELSKRILREKP